MLRHFPDRRRLGLGPRGGESEHTERDDQGHELFRFAVHGRSGLVRVGMLVYCIIGVRLIIAFRPAINGCWLLTSSNKAT